jgi:hypothetical protein
MRVRQALLCLGIGVVGAGAAYAQQPTSLAGKLDASASLFPRLEGGRQGVVEITGISA